MNGDATEDARGFTLLEVVVTVGVLIMLAAGSFVLIGRARAPVAQARAAFASALSQTASLARTAQGDDSGASLEIVAAGAGSRLTVYLGRPMPGHPAPRPAAPVATTQARVDVGTPPLAAATLAIGSGGRVDLIEGAMPSGSIAQPPGCGAAGTVAVAYVFAGETAGDVVDCRTAALAATPATTAAP